MRKRRILFLILTLALAVGLFVAAQASVTTPESGPAVGKHVAQSYILETGTNIITNEATGEQVTKDGLAGLPFLYPGDTVAFRTRTDTVGYVFTDDTKDHNFTTASKLGEDGKLHVEVIGTSPYHHLQIITKIQIVGNELVQLGNGQFSSGKDDNGHDYSVFVLKYRYVPMWCKITSENWFECNNDHHQMSADELANSGYYTNEQSSTRAWAEDSLTNGYGETHKEVLLTLRRPYIEGRFFSGISFYSASGKNQISDEYRINEGSGWHGNYWEGWKDNQVEIHPSLEKARGGYKDYSGSGSYDDELLVRFKYTYGRTVTFDACGGTIDGYPKRIYEAEGRQYFNQDLKDGKVDKAFKAGKAYVPVREGYYFAGWYEDAKYKTPVTSIKDTVSKYVENSNKPEDKRICRLYAKWLPIVKVKDCKLAAIEDQTVTGKKIEPKLALTYKGEKLEKGKDYTVSFKNNVKVGKATVTITGKGRYTGTKTASFLIIPKKVTLSSVKAGEESLTVQWKKGSDIDGYEIEYSLKKNFKGAKTITISKAKTTSTEIRKLTAQKKYYVRIRAFKKVKGKKYYSEWSKTLSATTK